MFRFMLTCLLMATCILTVQGQNSHNTTLKEGFSHPPNAAKPGVYWYFMDGNMTAESITKDLTSMKKAGIGHLVFLEVNVGIPRGPVDFLSKEWQDLFVHAVREAERLGIGITLGIGPGWTGSGGPWVPASGSMQQLVSSSTEIKGGHPQHIQLPVAAPKPPYFGEEGLPLDLRKKWKDYYKDVAVLAYPTPEKTDIQIKDLDEKALYTRAPFTSAVGVKQFLPSIVQYTEPAAKAVIDTNKIINLTSKLKADGSLDWDPPVGNWTVMRFVSRNNGAITRPAPEPGLGFEADKMDTAAMNDHLAHYVGRLIKKTGKPDPATDGGLKRLHMDSWEMGAQNWTPKFREVFIKNRGYDPLPFYPVYAGRIVISNEVSQRFLWDLRQTAQELVLKNYADHVKAYAHRMGLKLSIEPYDMNPTADLELGARADVPMAEFWSKGLGFNSSFSCFEATSIGHINGSSLIPAEAFTAQNDEGWKQYPGAMKNQGDWAFATGINRFVYHTFENQFLADSLRPGATMGPYGVHWDRNQTWWPMVGAYHDYVARCQFLLQQGRTVADVLYLTPEGAPHIFKPPASALEGEAVIPDRKGYNFDGCSPGQLLKANTVNGLVQFPGGARYRLLVLPAVKTMTPALLEKIAALVKGGAVVVGMPPVMSPGLSGYPACDQKIKQLSKLIWGDLSFVDTLQQRSRDYGQGKVIFGGALNTDLDDLYPAYHLTAEILKSMNVQPDFSANGAVRYTHRRIYEGTAQEKDLYFVSNRTDKSQVMSAEFRTRLGHPQLWNPNRGTIKSLPQFEVNGDLTTVPLAFAPYQSYFIVFSKKSVPAVSSTMNFPKRRVLTTLTGSWQVHFDPKWGGPDQVRFEQLQDWTKRQEPGIKYYSGTAVYRKVFDLPAEKAGNLPLKDQKVYLDLGEVKQMARVRLNGHDLGVLWTSPWSIDISSYLKAEGNQLEVEVVNLWPNRLIGDSFMPDDGIKDGKWPEWLLAGKPRPSSRFTFSTHHFYNKKSPLIPAGLLGPVRILISK